jgi:hypothetical protein
LKAPPPHYPPRPSAIHGPNPKLCARPGTWYRLVLTDLVRCCSAFAYTSYAPTTLDPRCSALGCEPEAPHSGQAIDSDRHAAVFHRSAAIIINDLLSAAPRFDMLRDLHRLLAPPSAHTIYHHRSTRAAWRYKSLARTTRAPTPVLPVPLPTTRPSEITREIRPLQPEHAIWSPVIFAQSKMTFLRSKAVAKQVRGPSNTHSQSLRASGERGERKERQCLLAVFTYGKKNSNMC